MLSVLNAPDQISGRKRRTMVLTVDNRNLAEMESYLIDRIEAMKRERDEIRRKIECRGWNTLDGLLAYYDEMMADRGISPEARKKDAQTH